MKTSESTLRVKVRCTELPGIRLVENPSLPGGVREPVYLGIQHDQSVIDLVPGDAREATFMPEFRVGQKSDGSPNFLGPFAQGSAADRFFYLSWGIRRPSGGFEMFRRLKIRLGHLGWPEIRRSIEQNKPIVVTLRLTDKKGCPLCATPPPTHIAWG